jgi:hypothetical protein
MLMLDFGRRGNLFIPKRRDARPSRNITQMKQKTQYQPNRDAKWNVDRARFAAASSKVSPPQAPSDINTHVRLFDLVRQSRATLHEDELITDSEYAWLCGNAPMAQGQGSPSPRRLEDYDEIRARMDRMEEVLKDIAAQKLFSEMDDHNIEGADWEGAYETIVSKARAALDPTIN